MLRQGIALLFLGLSSISAGALYASPPDFSTVYVCQSLAGAKPVIDLEITEIYDGTTAALKDIRADVSEDGARVLTLANIQVKRDPHPTMPGIIIRTWYHDSVPFEVLTQIEEFSARRNFNAQFSRPGLTTGFTWVSCWF